MNEVRLVAIGLICILVLWVISRKRIDGFKDVVAANEDESYVNRGDEPWERHPIHSVAVDLPTKFDTAYYYELDNAEYDIALKKTFQYPCKKGSEILNDANWKLLDSSQLSEVRTAYNSLLAYLENTLNASKHMELPSDNPYKRPKIQIVHDVLTQVKRHVATVFKYLIEMEIVIYREAKFNAKHVRITAIVEYVSKKKRWDFYVIEAELLGIVYEDKIGIFPVVASYDVHIDGRPYATLEKDESIYADPREQRTKDIIEKQASLQAANAATDIALRLE
jgi:hypothetical protein